MCTRLALLSFHGCPVARLGEKNTGGMNVYVLQMAREFTAMGFKVDIFTRYHDPDDPRTIELENGARIIHLNAGPLDAPKEDLFNYIPMFIRELYNFQDQEEARYDIIHSHYWLSGRVGMTLSRKWNIPHAATFHTLAKIKLRERAGERESQLRQDIEALVMSDADGIIVSTEEEKRDVIRLCNAPAHRVEVIPPGVNLSLFSPINKNYARRELGLTEENIILYVGRIEPLKGIDILLRAVPLLECANDLRVIVVGGNPSGDTEMERLKTISEELGIRNSVTFTGPLPQAQLPAYYSAADIFALPSHTESFGLAALEAMACGTPVVVSRVGGLKTFVENGRTGYLVPWRCPESFAQRLDTLLAAPDLRNAMGRAAREKALNMGWDRVADRMLGYYAGLAPELWAGVAGN